MITASHIDQRPRTFRRSTTVVALLILSSFFMSAGSPRRPIHDPATMKVRILYLGDAWGSLSPAPRIARDPMFSITPVPASAWHMGGIPDMAKYLRIYMPRTYRDLASRQDLVIFSDTMATYYSAKQLTWFRRGVEEAGQGLLMVGGRETQLGSWGGTSVEDVLPATFLGTQTFESTGFRAVPLDPRNELIRALPIDKMPPYTGLVVFVPREGSEIILKSNVKGYPILIYGEYGKGSAMIHSPDWTPGWGLYLWQWEYYDDFVSDMLYMLSGHPVPQDPALIHAVREYFDDYEVRKGLLTNLIDFIDRFGASTTGLERQLGEISIERREVSRLYMDQEYESVVSKMEGLLTKMDDLQKRAVELKDQALLWIYITETLALTGTSLFAGATLWMLMVRRRLYREVGVTRHRTA